MIEIRQAVSSDAETIAHFNIAICRETGGRELDPENMIGGVRRFVSDSKRGRCFSAMIYGQVVGQAAHTIEWSDWRNGELWLIRRVYLHPDFRSQGVFRMLFMHIKELGELCQEIESAGLSESAGRFQTGWQTPQTSFSPALG